MRPGPGRTARRRVRILVGDVPAPVLAGQSSQGRSRPDGRVTNAPFRRLCRRYGGGLFVGEMVSARAVVEGNPKTMKLTEFAGDETPRSLQLVAVDPVVVAEAIRRLIDTVGVDHVDLNFGCPVPKVTRNGGGAALPYKRKLLRAVVGAAVIAAGEVPVTIKFRVGIDDDHTTHLDTGTCCCGTRGRSHGTPRSDGGPAVQRRRRLGDRSASCVRSYQRRFPCTATVTSGRPETLWRWCARPGATGWWSAAAVSAAPGCSLTSTPCSPVSPSPRFPAVATSRR